MTVNRIEKNPRPRRGERARFRLLAQARSILVSDWARDTELLQRMFNDTVTRMDLMGNRGQCRQRSGVHPETRVGERQKKTTEQQLLE
jgi:hypothetical protein